MVLFLSWENSQHFAMRSLISLWSEVCETAAEIPYWWRVTFQIWVVLLIGRSKFSGCTTNQKHYPDLNNQWRAPHTSFRGETSRGVARCRLFSQTMLFHNLNCLTKNLDKFCGVYFFTEDKLYIIMELVEGAPLGEHFNSLKEKGTRFSEERIWHIFIQVLCWKFLVIIFILSVVHSLLFL